jgi:hypothetical protein
MPSFNSITTDMKKLRDPAKYVSYDTKTFAAQASPGIKSVMYKGTVQGEQNEYPVYVQFRGVTFADEAKPGYVPFEKGETEGQKTIGYYEVPDLGKNDCALKCMCFTGDTLIPLLEGYSVPIKDLIGRDYFYVYSFDTNKRKIVIGKGYNCEIKERNVSLVEITLDNGNKLRCTPEHEFYLKSGLKKEAKDLFPNDSLQALYRQLGSRDKIKDYEQILQGDRWEFTHDLADIYNLENRIYQKKQGTVRHHENLNKFNNSPENVVRMTWYLHTKLHHDRMVGENNPMKREEVKNKVKTTKEERGINKQYSERMINNNPMKNKDVVNQVIETNRARGNYSFERMRNMSLCKTEEGLKHIGDVQRNIQKELYAKGLHPFNKINAGLQNHKVISIKSLEEKEDVYCFTVEKYGNFFIDVDNSIDASSGVLVKNCSDFRFFWEHPLFVKKSLIGQFRRYVRVVPPSGRPPKNPQGILGVCKHIWSFVNALKEAKLVK